MDKKDVNRVILKSSTAYLPHTTRAKANVDLKTIQRISGHANITTTLNIYTHTREEEIQEAGDKIGELLGK